MNKKQIAILSTISNALLAVLKILVGLAAASSAILASGIDSLSDILSSLLVYIGIKFSEKETSAKYPYGLYRAESITSFIVFLFVLFASLGIIYESIGKLLTREFGVNINILALGVVIFAAIVSGILSYLKLKVGKSQNSVSLILDGKHSLIDVLTTIGVLIGLLVSHVLPIFDSIVGLLIGIYILFETAKMAKDVIEGLLDTADQQSEKQIRKLCSNEEIDIAELKSRKVAGRTFIEIKIVLPTDITVKKADDIIFNLQKLILNKIKQIEHVVIQIKGGSKRHPISRSNYNKRKPNITKNITPKLNVKKKGFRTIYPYKNGKIIKDFGSASYLIIDTKGKRIIQKKVVKNPYYHVGRSHGVKFARMIKADKVVASNIGNNAKKIFKQSKISVSR